VQNVRKAASTLNKQKTKIVADFAPASKADGTAAVEALDAALKDFSATVEAGDINVRFFQHLDQKMECI
jgi:hypothetical protein